MPVYTQQAVFFCVFAMHTFASQLCLRRQDISISRGYMCIGKYVHCTAFTSLPQYTIYNNNSSKYSGQEPFWNVFIISSYLHKAISIDSDDNAHEYLIVIFYHQRLFAAISVSCTGLAPPPPPPPLSANEDTFVC